MKLFKKSRRSGVAGPPGHFLLSGFAVPLGPTGIVVVRAAPSIRGAGDTDLTAAWGRGRAGTGISAFPVPGVFITHGDVGVGTIVGSAVFNILCIIGVCGLFAGQVSGLSPFLA